MNDDDDTLGIDLTAWETPRAPDGIADAVVARMREPIAAAADDLAARRTRRRWWMIGGALVATTALASISAFNLLGAGGGAASGSGAVVTAKPSHLDLGSSAADLDANTDVRWMRDGHRVVVSQSRGAASWKIDGSDHLVIDAGAAVASVEASGASLRVEVKMNPSDARTLGVSAATAAAVAVITVIVYKGQVDVTGAGQTVSVPPGSSVEVAPGKPPVPPVLVGDRLDVVDRALDVARDQVDDIKRLEAERAAMLTGDQAKHAEILRLQAEIAAMEAQIVQLANNTRPAGGVTSFDKSTAMAAMAALKPNVLACNDTTYSGALRTEVTIAADGTVNAVTITPSDTSIRSCVTKVIRAAKFSRSTAGGSLSFAYDFGTPSTVAGCDFDMLVAKGDAYVATAQHASALALFKQALQCRPGSGIVTKAYLAACTSKDQVSAHALFAQLPAAKQNYFSQACLRYGIDPTQAPTTPAVPSCNFDDLVAKADTLAASGQHGAALDRYQDALRCRRDPDVVPKAFIAACNSKNSRKVTELFVQLPPDKQNYYSQACLRYGIDPRNGATPAATCDFDDLVTKGDAFVASGQYGAALDRYEQALQCRGDGNIVRKAFLAACNARNQSKAKRYFEKLPVDKQNYFSQACLRYGTNPLDGGAATAPAPPASPTPTGPVGCDNRLVSMADANVAKGDHATALEMYEQALICKYDANVINKAYLAACNSKNQSKAAQYFAKLPVDKRNYFAVACVRYGIDPTKPPSVAATCDADKLRQDGDAKLSAGQNSAALASYEKSLRCRADANVVEKAFLASCNSRNQAKANEYLSRLPPAKQTVLSQLCLRNGIVPVASGAPATPAAGCITPDQLGPDDSRPLCNTKLGVLRVTSTPTAVVYVDGDESVKTSTPGTLELKPGRHKCTFLLNGKDRFTFPVTIKGGEVTTLHKDL